MSTANYRLQFLGASSASTASLEDILMKKGANYKYARTLVLEGRAVLGMSPSEPWTPELEAECIRNFQANGGGPIGKEVDMSTTSLTSEETSFCDTVESTPVAKSKTVAVEKVSISPEYVKQEQSSTRGSILNLVTKKSVSIKNKEEDATDEATETEAAEEHAVSREASLAPSDSKRESTSTKNKKKGIFSKIRRSISGKKTVNA
jgi:hypothetical protein